jgi:hypothetical protein
VVVCVSKRGREGGKERKRESEREIERGNASVTLISQQILTTL